MAAGAAAAVGGVVMRKMNGVCYPNEDGFAIAFAELVQTCVLATVTKYALGRGAHSPAVV